EVVELVDTLGSGSSGSNPMRVRGSPSAPSFYLIISLSYSIPRNSFRTPFKSSKSDFLTIF
ncbi:MAG: hypothetical protein KAJ00_04915, partial [Deltaproteobacteria bacterium]|nr:hypothetical protein [Deltaproteobacteria bacterium]